jgi:site-specific DNA-methyltransferase (adenine-specific)
MSVGQNIFEKNKIYLASCLDKLKLLDGNSVDLVIADPPYFKVVNEKWDYEWKTEQQYLDWCLEWMDEISRVLRYGGTFYLFGYFRTLALLVPYIDKLGLDLRQQILVDKGMRAVSGRATKNYKMFPNTTESILFMTKENRTFIKPFLKEQQVKVGLSSKQINEALGVKSNGGGMWSIYTGKNICEQFPTKDLWNKLQSILKFDIEYESVAQTFNPQMGLTDIWRDIDFYKEKRIHPTQKPLPLIERLVLASSNENDLILDPFAGSCSTAIACIKTKRNWIMIEKDEQYYNLSLKRVGDFLNSFSHETSNEDEK